MDLWTIKKLYAEKPIGTEVKIGGWVKSQRNSKSFTFIVLNDGSTQNDIQVIADEVLEGYEDFVKCGTGSSMLVHGKVVASQGKQEFEIQAIKVEFFHKAEDDYPLQKKGTSMATPVVAGIAAVIRGINPSLTNYEVRNLIMNNSVRHSAMTGPQVHLPARGHPWHWRGSWAGGKAGL